MAQGAKKERDTENEMAIGGMRNPRRSAQRLPGTLMMGAAIGKLLLKAAEHPSVQKLVADLTEGRPATQVKAKLTNKVRNLVLKVLNVDLGNMPSKTAKAETPLHPEVLWAWGQATDDPDACTLAEWLRIGAPLGFSEDTSSQQGCSRLWMDSHGNRNQQTSYIAAWRGGPTTPPQWKRKRI